MLERLGQLPSTAPHFQTCLHAPDLTSAQNGHSGFWRDPTSRGEGARRREGRKEGERERKKERKKERKTERRLHLALLSLSRVFCFPSAPSPQLDHLPLLLHQPGLSFSLPFLFATSSEVSRKATGSLGESGRPSQSPRLQKKGARGTSGVGRKRRREAGLEERGQQQPCRSPFQGGIVLIPHNSSI